MGRTLALTLLACCVAGVAAAGPDPLQDLEEGAPLRKRELDPEYDERTGQLEWNPLAAPVEALRGELDRRGIVFALDSAVFFEAASESAQGHRNFGTLAWDFVGDWRLLRDARVGTTFLGWDLVGSTGFDYGTDDDRIASDLGPATSLNANIVADDVAMNELFLRQLLLDDDVTVMGGRIDLSSWFDTNRAANDSFRQFFAYPLENNPSIPWPQYGGLGALVRVELGEDAHAMLGVGDSSSDEPFAFWKTVGGDWYGILELGATVDVAALGEGHVLVMPWFDRLSGKSGAGVGINLDQELGLERLIGFLRAGWGDEDVTPIETFVSGGLLLEQPLGREADTFGLGVAWSDPSPSAGARNETLVEAFYEIGLSPTISLTPDLQVLVHPARNRDHDVLLVGGLRLELRF